MTRILAMGDLHCGNYTGLTPPNWEIEDGAGPINKRGYRTIRRVVWDWITAEVADIKKPDVLILNADMIDGNSKTDQLYQDRLEQVDMAYDAITMLFSKKLPEIYMSLGSRFHVGEQENFEHALALRLEAKALGAEGYIDVNGCIINYKHAVGDTNNPYGRATSLEKEIAYNMIGAEEGRVQRANVLLRSHNHYCTIVESFDTLAIAIPGLQVTSDYGNRLASRRLIDVGFIELDISDKGIPLVRKHIASIPMMEAIKVTV